MTKRYWMGTINSRDDFGAAYGDIMYDGKTRMGPWANMSEASWQRHGIGCVGQGFAQKYEKQADGRWLKVRGMKMEKKKQELPPLIKDSDLKFPGFMSKDRVDTNLGDYGSLTFYNTVGFGWCIATLRISNGRRGRDARTYAARISDGAQVRIGNGPHVTSTVTIHIRQSRVKALQKYIDLYSDGAIKANTTRDRISSRRAEGSLRRARGEHFWRWSV